MKINNISNKLVQNQIQLTQSLAMKGDFLSAFFATRDFCNRIPDCPVQLYDFQMELADVLNNPNLTFDIACKELDIYQKMPFFDFGKTFRYLSLSLLKMNKIPQLKRFLQTYDLEKHFLQYKKVKNHGITKQMWDNYKEPSMFDKINISTLSLWHKYENSGRLEEIADSKVDIKPNGKYYSSLRLMRGQAMINLGRVDEAIAYIQSTDKSYSDKDIFCLLSAYNAKSNPQAVEFFTHKLVSLAKKNKIDNEYIGLYLHFFESQSRWQQLYDLCKAYLLFRPTDHLVLTYYAFASYNIGQKQQCEDIISKMNTIYPYCSLPIRILQFGMEMGDSIIRYSAPCPAEIEQSYRLNYETLVGILDDKKALNNFFTSKNSVNDFVCYISYMKAPVTADALDKIITADTRFETVFGEILRQQSITLSAKLPILRSFIKNAKSRHLVLEANHFIYAGVMHDMEQISHYGQHFVNIYANTLCYLIDLTSNIEVFLPLYNYCIDLFSKQIISNNIKLLEKESAISSIIINLYLLLTFSQFPEEILTDNLGIKREDIMSFNYLATSFGLKIVDRVLYINEQPVNIIEMFQSSLDKNSSIRLIKKDK